MHMKSLMGSVWQTHLGKKSTNYVIITFVKLVQELEEIKLGCFRIEDILRPTWLKNFINFSEILIYVIIFSPHVISSTLY